MNVAPNRVFQGQAL